MIRGAPAGAEPMLNSKKVVVVLPANNAARTLRRTVDEIPARSSTR